MPWRQFAWLNAFFASLATTIIYAFVHRLTGSARAAALAAVFHFGCGFVLLLSVISEDIMPGYALVLGAMALAGLWFDRPTHARVALVAALFLATNAHFFHYGYAATTDALALVLQAGALFMLLAASGRRAMPLIPAAP